MFIDRKKLLGVPLAALALTASAAIIGVDRLQKQRKKSVPADSIVVHTGNVEMGFRSKMSASVHPVEMAVERRSIRIQSEYSQLLPVYRQNGSFYMLVRLNKGVNWLNGLPAGKYYINNKQITIK